MCIRVKINYTYRIEQKHKTNNKIFQGFNNAHVNVV